MEINLENYTLVLMIYVLGALLAGGFFLDTQPKIVGTWIATSFIIMILAVIPVDILTHSSRLYSTQKIDAAGLVKDEQGYYQLIINNIAIKPSDLVDHKVVDIVFVDDDTKDIELRTHRETRSIRFFTLWEYKYELVVNKKYMIWDTPRGDF